MVGYIAPDRVRGLTTLRAKSPETARVTGRPQHDSSAKRGSAWFSRLRARGKRYKQSDQPAGINLRPLVEQYVRGKCLHQMSRAPRILVIDDDRADRRLFERTLSQDGYCVACVKSGREALVLTRTTAFDLVVLDLSLGDMDGFRLLNEIRTESPLARVLVVSGVMKSFLPGIVRDAGAHAALAKPISPANLREAVYQLLDPTCSWQGGQPDT